MVEKNLLKNPTLMFGDDTVIYGLDLIYNECDKISTNITFISFDDTFKPLYFYTTQKSNVKKKVNILIFLHMSHFVCCKLDNDCLQVYDSLSNYVSYTTMFEKFFNHYYNVRDIQHCACIQQTNNHDCGAYALLIAKYLSSSPVSKIVNEIYIANKKIRYHVLNCLTDGHFYK